MCARRAYSKKKKVLELPHRDLLMMASAPKIFGMECTGVFLFEPTAIGFEGTEPKDVDQLVEISYYDAKPFAQSNSICATDPAKVRPDEKRDENEVLVERKIIESPED